MIPAAFDYAAPESVADALAALGSDVDEVKVLAGGQSLIPVLRLRMAAPDLVVDLGRIDELRGVRDDGEHLVIGSMTSHDEMTRNRLVAEHATLLQQAAQTVADPQVRHRGTFGGSLTHADPAGDMPAAALALDAEMVIQGPSGERTVPAADFFWGLFTTAVGEDELLTHVRVSKHTGWGSHYEKFNRVAQQWSIVAVAAAVRVEGGQIAQTRVALTNMAATALRAHGVESALSGQPVSAEAIREAAGHAAEGTEPSSDLNGDADYRRQLAEVLTRRALLAAAGA